MGQVSRYFFVFAFLICTSCSVSKAPFTELPRSDADRIYETVGRGDWPGVYKLSKDGTDPLLQILRQRALYEMKKFDEVLAAPPIKDFKFAPYDVFLRGLSAFENKKWDQIRALEIPSDLPAPLRERLTILQGEALQELQETEKARDVYTLFLKKFKNSPFETDVLFRLADIEFSLHNNEKAFDLYEQIYRFHPIDDSDDIALQKLIHLGRFSQIDTDVHLSRILRLQRAARFKRAERELSALQTSISKDKLPRVQLAGGQLYFAERQYHKSEIAARKALRYKLPANLEIEWRQILASSLVRQNQPDPGKLEFQRLLALRIPSTVEELALYKLAMLALDNKNYLEASNYFEKLRKKFPKGHHTESAYWFAVWAIYENELARPGGADLGEVKNALKLLQELSELPTAKSLLPQIIY